MGNFIGNEPATSFETVRKQVSTSNSGTTITLDHAVTNVQDILVTINAVVQSYDNYSVSGTTLTVGGTLSNDRVEILYVGRTFQSVNPSASSVGTSQLVDDAVTGAKLNTDVISAQTELASEPADTDEFLVSDAGVIKRIDYSLIKGGGTLVPLSTISSTSNTTTHTFSDVFSSTYSNYFILCHHCQLATDNEKMMSRMRSASGQFTTTSYNLAATGFRNGSSAGDVTFYNTNSSSWDLTTNIDNTNTDVGRATFFMYVTTPNSTTFVTDIIGQASYRKESQDRSVANFSGTVNSKTAFTGIDFLTSSGDIAQFNATCYGIKTS
jgi:hypothetical protein